MPVQPEKVGKCKCVPCDREFETGRSLAAHIQNYHKIKSKEYTIKYLYNGVQPMCPECGDETRYTKYSFKTYCKEHARMAMRTGGRKGGQAEAWNKGKTISTDRRILKSTFPGESNPFFGKKHTTSSRDKMRKSSKITKEQYEERVSARLKDFTPLTEYKDYKSRQGQKLEFKCNACSSISKKTLLAFERGSECYTCHTPGKGSKGEREVQNFIESLGFEVEANTRKIITPKELDIYIPAKQLAVEYNGLYWHSQDKKEDKDYHLNKSLECAEKGISLFHIFSDEWNKKQEIIKSMLRYRLDKVETRYYARKCEIREGIYYKDRKAFFEKSHISGDVQSSTAFGLFHEGEMVACLSLRKPTQQKYKDLGCIEIARYANILNSTVVGGFSKLLKVAKRWAAESGYNKIMTYSDLRFGNQDKAVYSATFKEIGRTVPDYWYSDNEFRYHRYEYRATDSLTERQHAESVGVKRIYGCGSRIFMADLPAPPKTSISDCLNKTSAAHV